MQYDSKNLYISNLVFGTKTFQIYEQYGGSQLTSILEEIKSMTEDVSA